MLAKLGPAELQRYAWIGDAVLLLYARQRVLDDTGKLDDARCVRMTSNQFLSGLGEPTRVEAEIGKIYAESGYDTAAAWIEKNLGALFRKQEEKRARTSRAKSKNRA